MCIPMYVCMCVYIYIYIYIYVCQDILVLYRAATALIRDDELCVHDGCMCTQDAQDIRRVYQDTCVCVCVLLQDGFALYYDTCV
jgi:hypothetical protein